ncbi:hypothetical protein evm_004302 [Chilo suppressalis]|nr:hypothetical protein evm_004302 [Chilo suppressalis]
MFQRSGDRDSPLGTSSNARIDTNTNVDRSGLVSRVHTKLRGGPKIPGMEGVAIRVRKRRRRNAVELCSSFTTAPVDKSNFAMAALNKCGFETCNHPLHSLDLALTASRKFFTEDEEVKSAIFAYFQDLTKYFS